MLTCFSIRIDKLTTSWRNEEDLFAYYFLDGRPHPVMEYSMASDL